LKQNSNYCQFVGNDLERKARKHRLKQIKTAESHQPVISKETRTGSYPSTVGDIHRFAVSDEHSSFAVSH